MTAAHVFFTVVVPAGLFSIMIGMGLSLTPADILRVVTMPKAALIGLCGQMLLLPLLAFALAEIFAPPPVIAIGLVLLAACPGGITSNAYSFASRADVALSVTMTTISSLFTVITMPLLTYAALYRYAPGAQLVHLPLGEIMGKLVLAME